MEDVDTIGHGTTGITTLQNGMFFGAGVTMIDDLNGDGRPDMVVGADGFDAGGPNGGAIVVIQMGAGGLPESSSLVASTQVDMWSGFTLGDYS